MTERTLTPPQQPSQPSLTAVTSGGENVWYHVLKCRPVRHQSSRNHFEVLADCAGQSFWFTVNVRYVAPQGTQPTDNVMYLTNDAFEHPITAKLKAANLPWGFTEIPEQPDGLALDYVRSNLLDLSKMRSLANPDATVTDLSELLASYLRRVQNAPDAVLYVFGSKFPLPGREQSQGHNPFGIDPNIGLHDVHLNQGSIGRFARSNAPWQDGLMLIHFPSTDTWAAIFLGFETQIRTLTGQPQPTPQPGQPMPQPTPEQPVITAATVQLVAALVDPSLGDETGREQVYLLNTTKQPIDLSGWHLEDGRRKREPLTGSIAARQFQIVTLSGTVRLPNQGGLLTLYDANDTKVHGVSYVRGNVSGEDTLVVF